MGFLHFHNTSPVLLLSTDGYRLEGTGGFFFKPPFKPPVGVFLSREDYLFRRNILNGKMKEYPSLRINHSTKVSLGRAMKELEFDHTEHSHVVYYKVVPLKAV